MVRFPRRKGPRRTGASRSWRGQRIPRDVGKEAPAAIERDTAWLARRGGAGPEVPLPTPSASLAHGTRPPEPLCIVVSLCIAIRILYLYPQRACHAETTRQRRGGYELLILEPAKARSIENATESPGMKRHAAYRDCNKDAAFDEGWDAAPKWQTEFAEVADGVR